MSAARTLIWDFDGTLATRPGEWTATLCEALRSVYPARPIDPERIRPHTRRGFPWHDPDAARPPRTAEDWWETMLPVFEAAFVEGADLDPADARPLARRIRAVYTEPTAWQLYDDTIPVLAELTGRGFRHVILSNHVPELPRIVDALGLRPYFDAVYCSADLGLEKPNRRAFERVLADHPAARAGWMIGDSWKADVLGARGAGLRAILVRRDHQDADLRCETLHGVVPIVCAAREANAG